VVFAETYRQRNTRAAENCKRARVYNINRRETYSGTDRRNVSDHSSFSTSVIRGKLREWRFFALTLVNLPTRYRIHSDTRVTVAFATSLTNRLGVETGRCTRNGFLYENEIVSIEIIRKIVQCTIFKRGEKKNTVSIT